MELNETIESQINRSDYKILIVDDVVSNVLLLKILLTNEKFQVCTASNGNMCIEMAKSEHPDLILLDVMMPDLNGFDTAVILKKDPETHEIPITTSRPTSVKTATASKSASPTASGTASSAMPTARRRNG